jgi:ATP-dependent Lon protease
MSEKTTQLSEVLYLTAKLDEADIPLDLKEKISLKIKRLRRMARQGQSAGEYESVAKYIDWCLSIPWKNYIKDNIDLISAKKVMDSIHYGSEDVKSVVLEYLAMLSRKYELKDSRYSSPVLAFVGVQGSGKTSLARAIATALGRPFYRISLGALGHASELRGSPSDNLGSEPGSIVRSIVRARCMNPVILLDEFDKVSGDEGSRKDFMAIMLELLDPEQNTTFRDWYVDYPLDLSKVLFIATANRFTTISRELLDRLEFIEFNDYKLEEKAIIAKYYLFPKVLQYAGLTKDELIIENDVWGDLVNAFGREQGVRRLERNLQKLARGVLKQITMKETVSVKITKENVDRYTKLALPSIEKVRGIDYTLSKKS